MIKKTKKTEEKTSVTPVVATPPVNDVKKLGRIEIGFPNEDLNKLVGKINEIIDYINNA